MELRHLRYFVAVAEVMSFRGAAEALHMTQPPLSQQIKQLEDELDVQLFDRVGRSIQLTAAGQAFLEDARRLLSQADEAKDHARRAARGEVGQLAIGFVGSAAYRLLPRLLAPFRQRFPMVNLTLRELPSAAQLSALQDGHIDIGFARLISPLDSTYDAEAVLVEKFVAVLPRAHPLAAHTAIALDALADEAFIMFPPDLSTGLYDTIIGMCWETGFTPRITQSAIQLATIIGLVAGGLGVSVLPASVAAFVHEGAITVPLVNSPHTALHLVKLRDHAPPVVTNFVDLTREVSTASL